MSSSEQNVMDVFAEFVRLRQAGSSRDEAWEQIETLVNTLSQREQARLITLLRAWEAKEGRHYKPSRVTDPYSTQHTPPEELAEVRKEAAGKPSVIRRIKPRDEAANTVLCPSCHKPNPANEAYCYSCGALLVSIGGTQQIADTQPVGDPEVDTAYFDDQMTLFLHIFGAPQPLRVRPREDEMVIGRRSPDSVMIPDIDLSPYHADTMGVSRLHAGLRRMGNTIVLTDMGSLNQTYINGQRLHAHEVRVLRDGDELKFGQLTIRLYFKHE
ncbi:MAG TPA: FHA domain-containing protein [Aggregatilineaceae bacterium]|nr:FHA domain-containing protein [Aggregatilineaceae bacterium]